MYHYLHRPWYTKQSTIYHSWQKPLRFVQSIVYGILMSIYLVINISLSSQTMICIIPFSIIVFILIMFLLITLYIKTAYLSCYVGLFLKKGLGDCSTNPHPLLLIVSLPEIEITIDHIKHSIFQFVKLTFLIFNATQIGIGKR